MLITLNVTKETYQKWVEVASAIREVDDYYDTSDGCRYLPGEMFPPIITRAKFNHPDINEVRCGWFILVDVGEDVAQYTTFGGNSWGMKKEKGDESFIAYFYGHRSRIRDFIKMMKDSDPSFKKETASIIVHESAAPSAMHWWETKDEYAARRAAEKEEARRRSDRKFARENNPFSVLKGIKAKQNYCKYRVQRGTATISLAYLILFTKQTNERKEIAEGINLH